MTRDEVVKGYFDWLLEAVTCDLYAPGDYWYLLDILFDTEFYWTLDRDSNRADDGMHLRLLYSQEHPVEGHKLLRSMPEFCTVLEMLIALAKRCENEVMYDPDQGDRTALWFWIMLENLGLTSYNDRAFRRNHRRVDQYVDDILTTFMYREFEPDGTGSIFRVKNVQADMRDTELWYQMQYYVNENFDI